jgi:hypothetical protein
LFFLLYLPPRIVFSQSGLQYTTFHTPRDRLTHLSSPFFAIGKTTRNFRKPTITAYSPRFPSLFLLPNFLLQRPIPPTPTPKTGSGAQGTTILLTRSGPNNSDVAYLQGSWCSVSPVSLCQPDSCVDGCTLQIRCRPRGCPAHHLDAGSRIPMPDPSRRFGCAFPSGQAPGSPSLCPIHVTVPTCRPRDFRSWTSHSTGHFPIAFLHHVHPPSADRIRNPHALRCHAISNR